MMSEPADVDRPRDCSCCVCVKWGRPGRDFVQAQGATGWVPAITSWGHQKCIEASKTWELADQGVL